jgi:pimeloyl-ACP methyl ester carboxylesterase
MASFQSFDGKSLNYQIHSQPKNIKNSIVVIHGFGGDIGLLDEFIHNLTNLETTQIISYELRGHINSSHHFSKKFSTFEKIHTLDLQSLLQHLNVESPIMIGHSLGGIIIQEYINKNLKPTPKQLFFICTTTQILGSNYFRKFLYKILCQFPETKKPFSKPQKPSSFYKKFKTSWDIDLFRFSHDTRVVGGFTKWFLYFFSLNGWKNKNLRSIDHKDNYYIYGKKDIIVPALLQKYKIRKLENINKIEINSGHIAPVTHPEQLATLIKKYLKT